MHSMATWPQHICCIQPLDTLGTILDAFKVINKYSTKIIGRNNAGFQGLREDEKRARKKKGRKGDKKKTFGGTLIEERKGR